MPQGIRNAEVGRDSGSQDSLLVTEIALTKGPTLPWYFGRA